MQFSVCSFIFATLVVFLAVQVSEARHLSSDGLLNEMPKNCSGLDYCFYKHDKYPQDRIDDLLSNKFRLTLGTPHDTLIYRQGSGTDSNTCEKDETYGMIYEIIDKFDNVRVVVQSPTLFRQQIRVERCLSSTPTGLDLSSTEVENNNLICVDKMLHYNFLVLTLDGKGVEYAKSKHGIPVCCSCKYSN